jgi:hypothetical protein
LLPVNTVAHLPVIWGYGLRDGNLLGVILCVAAVSCAPLPEAWTRVDGRRLDPKELSSDRAICQGEIKANLSAGNQTTIWGPTEDAITVYTGCMARRGYMVVK